jgi:hypothetical protein
MNRLVRSVVGYLAALKRKLYGGGSRPGALMRAVDRGDALLYASGVFAPRHAVALEVVGRKAGASWCCKWACTCRCYWGWPASGCRSSV